MDIVRPRGRSVELWVQDDGKFDGFAVFFDGDRVLRVVDQGPHRIEIPEETVPLTIAIQFGGSDRGGVSAVVDNTNPKDQDLLGSQQGLRHLYIVRTSP